jgi:hypothetical protein
MAQFGRFNGGFWPTLPVKGRRSICRFWPLPAATTVLSE